MSETTPTRPAQAGLIEAPNPIELIWEKYKKLINLVIFALVLALVGKYVWREMEASKVNELWGGFASSTGLDKGYTEDGTMIEFLRSQAGQPQSRFNPWPYYAMGVQTGLVTELTEHIKDLEGPALEAEVQRVKGTAAEPLVLWVMAVRAASNHDWTGARKHIADLKGGFEDHFLCASSEYPVQWREEIEDKEKDDEEKPKKKKDPEYKPAQAGSLVDRFLAAMDREEAFRAANARFYVIPAPDSKETVTFKFSGLEGSIKVQFYTSKAPKHVEAFLKLAKAEGGWWKGMRIHEVIREPDSSTGPATRGEIHFGIPGSKELAREKWIAEDPAELIDWEDNDLSHFPGMLVVESAKEGKSQVERLVITTADLATSSDGTRVIIGRVIEGFEFAQQIAEQELSSESEMNANRGKLRENITIAEVIVEGA